MNFNLNDHFFTRYVDEIELTQNGDLKITFVNLMKDFPAEFLTIFRLESIRIHKLLEYRKTKDGGK